MEEAEESYIIRYRFWGARGRDFYKHGISRKELVKILKHKKLYVKDLRIIKKERGKND